MNDALVETWRINACINLYLLDALSPEQLVAPVAKGKTAVGHLAHVHNVRLMWLKAAAEELLEGVEKLDPKAADGAALREALGRSADRIGTLIERAETPEGRVKGFKPHCAGFVGYLIAHESFHRAQVELGLRQAGLPLSDKVAYGMWEWGARGATS
ncbi:MAG: DinB family protein [Fimbriimonadaceae bacterium]|nr:DinB family protein [Chthonomonadaceae bacterium]MCO5297382.1 DinB family protein [Fimbriimonadaceae bacterium]